MNIKEYADTVPFYRVISTQITDEDGVSHTTYGIEAIDKNGDLIRRIEDISLYEQEVKDLSRLLNQHKVSMYHFKDVVEDYLEQ